MKSILWASIALLTFACSQDAAPETSGESHWQIGETGTNTDTLSAAFARYAVCADGRTSGTMGEYFEAVFDGETLVGPLAADFGRQFNCVNAAADCDAVLACTGQTAAECNDDAPSTCEGTVRVRCLGGQLVRRTECADDPDGNTRCVDGLCVAPPSDDACIDGCNGDVLVDCESSERRDCALRGRTCLELEGEDGISLACFDGGADCTPCAGETARYCQDGVIRSQVNCAALGLVCNPNHADTDEQACVAAESECEHGDSQCQGNTAQICFGGQWFDFDCAQANGQCATFNGSATCAARIVSQ